MSYRQELKGISKLTKIGGLYEYLCDKCENIWITNAKDTKCPNCKTKWMEANHD